MQPIYSNGRLRGFEVSPLGGWPFCTRLEPLVAEMYESMPASLRALPVLADAAIDVALARLCKRPPYTREHPFVGLEEVELVRDASPLQPGTVTQLQWRHVP